MGRIITFGSDARNKMLEGISELEEAVISTLGPKGHTVILSTGNGHPIVTKDGVSVARFIYFSDKYKDIGASIVKEGATKTNAVAGDGPQPLYAGVLTPNGFIELGSLKVGDKICGTNNSIQEVVGFFPKGKKRIYNVVFEDGSVVECSEDHLWTVTNSSGKVKTTALGNLTDFVKKTPYCNKYKYYVPVTKVDFQEKALPLDPLLVGMLLGDGSLSEKSHIDIELGIGYNKKSLIDEIILPEGIYMISRDYPNKKYIRYCIRGKTKDNKTIKDILSNIGLLGTNSSTKFIPDIYKYNSVANRNRLLRGLLGTDGHINNRGRFEYSTISVTLRNDFVELTKGLGYQLGIHTYKDRKNAYGKNTLYRITELKGNKYGNKIINIIDTGVDTEMACIKVSNPDELYITNNYIVTHNTTTSTLLTSELCKAGTKLVDMNLDAIEVKRGFEKACSDVLVALDKQKRVISGEKDIEHVATISANNDSEIGKIIAEAFTSIGDGGIVNAIGANNRSGKTSITFTTGMEIDKGLISGVFVNTNNSICELHNPAILVYGKPLKQIEEIQAIIQIVKRQNKSIVICAPVYEDKFRSDFIDAVEKKQISGALIYPRGQDRVSIDQFIEDLAVQVGAKVLEGKSKITIDNFDPNTMLGSAELITISKKKTVITGGAGTDEEIEARVKEIQADIEKGNSDVDDDVKSLIDIDLLKERIANLSGGIATIHIGALSAVELKEKKDRYEDAINAVNAAISEGVISGGGTGLLHAVKEVSEMHKPLEDPIQERGYQTFLSICEMPAKRIIDSTGKKADYIIEKIKETNNINYGYNAKKEELSETMYEDGVIDPILVTKTALSYATSIAGTFISTNCVIFDEAMNVSVQAIDPLLDEDRSNIIK